MADTLEIRNLVKNYGKKKVLRDISFTMKSGEVVGILGPNGAGKTTSFYIIVGFIKANSGSILLNGEDITDLPMYRRALKGLSYLPQEPSIFRKLSVEDNIMLVLETRDELTKPERKEKLEKLISDFGLEEVRKQKGYTLSGGERRRTEIARSLATEPKFLLLDEPFAGIDPKAVYDIKRIISKLSRKGIGIILTDHNVRDTLSITTCAHIINQGTILVSGTRAQLLENEEARTIYFGDSFDKV